MKSRKAKVPSILGWQHPCFVSIDFNQMLRKKEKKLSMHKDSLRIANVMDSDGLDSE